jgi:hypothetical protein
MDDDLGRVASQPGSQATPSAAVPASSPVGADPSRDESTLKSKARALAASVWDEHRKTAVMTFDTISDDARNILIDCCLKGMCVGMIAGSSLLRDSDGSGEAGETGTGSTEGDSAGPKDIAHA